MKIKGLKHIKINIKQLKLKLLKTTKNKKQIQK